jgi:hypothetical protein
MINAGTLIKEVARYLTDFDETEKKFQHVEWTKLDLFMYLRMSLVMASSSLPKRFSKQVTVSLTGESPVKLPTECEQYLGTVAAIDADGTRHTNIRELPRDSTIYTMRRSVCADGTSKVSSVRQSSSSDTAVEVIPGDAGGKLVVDCFCPPSLSSPDGEIDMPSAFEPVLFWWMVSMAFGTDIESVPMRERSDAYWSRGVTALMMVSPSVRAPTNPNVRATT